jgi:hypothetical protein
MPESKARENMLQVAADYEQMVDKNYDRDVREVGEPRSRPESSKGSLSLRDINMDTGRDERSNAGLYVLGAVAIIIALVWATASGGCCFPCARGSPL